MANIAVRKGEEKRMAPMAPSFEWEPGRLMRSLLNWDPFREMMPFIPEERGALFSPAFEVKETEKSYIFKADVPGVREADLEVTLTGNRLTVSGKREAEREEKTDTYYACERSYGTFSRSFTLPEGTDAMNVSADLRDGVLTLTLPKTPEVQPKKISIKSQTTPSAKA